MSEGSRDLERLIDSIRLTRRICFLARSTVTGSLGIPEQQRYIEQVEALESYQRNQQQYRTEPELPESVSPPEFITPIKSQKNIMEGGFAHFDARLEPLNDPTLRVEWFKDGKPVDASKHSLLDFLWNRICNLCSSPNVDILTISFQQVRVSLRFLISVT